MTNLKKNRKICIVTGSRAEYGSLYWLLKEIQEDVNLDLQVIATGTHLSPEFGLTYQIIENDGFPISAIVEMLLSSDRLLVLQNHWGLGLLVLPMHWQIWNQIFWSSWEIDMRF